MDADGDMRMAERSRRPSSCRILHDVCNLSREERKVRTCLAFLVHQAFIMLLSGSHCAA